MAKNGRQGEGGGKPLIVFDEKQTNQVESLAAVLSKTQMADYFGISLTTLIEIERGNLKYLKLIKGVNQKLLEM